jgi:hypothetical protein
LRTRVNDRPELELPFVDRSTPVTWNPQVFQSCAYSDQAGPVPQLELEWNDTQTPDRFDLTIMYRGLEDRLYTTAYPVGPGAQFLIPSDSQFLTDDQALRTAGLQIFPDVVELSSVPIDSGGDPRAAFAPLRRYRLGLSGVGEGISVTLRASTLNDGIWSAAKRTEVLGEVCLRGDPITR